MISPTYNAKCLFRDQFRSCAFVLDCLDGTIVLQPNQGVFAESSVGIALFNHAAWMAIAQFEQNTWTPHSLIVVDSVVRDGNMVDLATTSFVDDHVQLRIPVAVPWWPSLRCGFSVRAF